MAEFREKMVQKFKVCFAKNVWNAERDNIADLENIQKHEALMVHISFETAENEPPEGSIH